MRALLLAFALAGCGVVVEAPAPESTHAAPAGALQGDAPADPATDPVCGALAPSASPCCAIDLGCVPAPTPMPVECVPPPGACWERMCALTDGTFVAPGTCEGDV